MTVSDSHWSRRAFAKHGIGLGLFAGLTATGHFAKAFEAYEPRVLTPHELAAVIALMARLIPADRQSGGAVEACAHVYLDQALGAYHARHRETYRNALAELDRLSQQRQAASFAALPPAQADALIGAMERGELRSERFPDGGSAFFNLIRRHTLEGFLSDPMYGGNQAFVGWKVIGYNGVQLTYSARAQQLNGRDERDERSIAAFGGSPMR